MESEFTKGFLMSLFISLMAFFAIAVVSLYLESFDVFTGEKSDWIGFASYTTGLVTPIISIATVVLLYFTWKDNKKEMQEMTKQAARSNQREMAAFYQPLIVDELAKLKKKLPSQTILMEINGKASHYMNTNYKFHDGAKRYIYSANNEFLNKYIIRGSEHFKEVSRDITNESMLNRLYEDYAVDFFLLASQVHYFGPFSGYINTFIIKELKPDNIEALLVLFTYKALEEGRYSDFYHFYMWLDSVYDDKMHEIKGLASNAKVHIDKNLIGKLREYET